VDGGRRHTWAETRSRAGALAKHLAERGVRAGDRVAILEGNSIPYLESYFAAAGAGAILVPLNTRLLARELAVILADCRPGILLHGADFAELAGEAARESGVPISMLALCGPQDASSPYERIVSAGDHYVARSLEDTAVAQLYYTSGTTGQPKGVMLTHRNVTTHARACVEELALSSGDVWGHFAPMFHLADAWASFAITAVGGRHCFLGAFDARASFAILRDEGVTITNLVPTMLVRWIDLAEREGAPVHRLRLLLSGGAPIAPELVRRIVSTFSCEYAQTYGMTETSPYLTISLLREHHRSLTESQQIAVRAKTGRAFGPVELEVVDSDDRCVPRDQRSVGEIRVRGPTVSPGYWQRPEETRRAHRGGWLYTGDLAVIDGEGYLTIVDRKKDMILSGGENVYSTEVENALYEHEAIMEAAAFGLPDREWGEIVCAAIVLRAGRTAQAEEILAHCRERLAGYKCPRRLFLVDDLPRTGTGKIKKLALRERYSPL
jgi:acyl-CoA synthetase (AMP-forming)/AMP-acid ligase II